jgi:hypothetical protein
LPQLAAANDALQVRIAAEGREAVDVEAVSEEEEEDDEDEDEEEEEGAGAASGAAGGSGKAKGRGPRKPYIEMVRNSSRPSERRGPWHFPPPPRSPPSPFPHSPRRRT